MKIINYLDAKPIPELPGVVKREVITDADGAPNYSMRIFEVDPGSSTPFHFHPWEHEVFVISGHGVVKSENEEIKIEKESVVFVAPNEQHSFVNKGNELLRFVCVVPLLKG
jgi:quercetin dioxygenase-like cupin family protein